MEFAISNLLAFLTFLLSITFIILFKRSISRNSGKQHPPGPPGWPVIGNILDLGSNAHQSLYKLRFKYGDLLWLRLGWTDTLVIQTAKAAEQLFENHNTSFCDRKVPEAWHAHNYTKGSLSVGRYTHYWRVLRRLITLGLMTNKHIQETAPLHRKCTNDMIQFIQEDSDLAKQRGESGEIELSKYLYVLAFNLMGNLVLSQDLVTSQSELGIEFFHAMDKVMELGGKPNLSDFFPLLKRFDLQRVKKDMEIHLGRTLSIVDKFLSERIEEQKLSKEREVKDLLDTLLEYNESCDPGVEPISSRNLLIIVVEMFLAGTETTSATIEWVMTELLRNPDSMRGIKEELNTVVGPNKKVEESHIEHLPYLHAVIKETMRLHPVVPLLVPRNALEDTTFMAYNIPKGTQIFVNAWAIGRDPDAWEDPLTFKPERFLKSNIQYRGQNFELIPFGSGRRMCVGYSLAHQILHLTIASLLHYFDWEVNSKSVVETINLDERCGITVRKLIPLKVLPKKKVMED